MPLVLAGLVAVGAVIRFIVAGQDLFADELATYWISGTKGLPDVVGTRSALCTLCRNIWIWW